MRYLFLKYSIKTETTKAKKLTFYKENGSDEDKSDWNHRFKMISKVKKIQYLFYIFHSRQRTPNFFDRFKVLISIDVRLMRWCAYALIVHPNLDSYNKRQPNLTFVWF